MIGRTTKGSDTMTTDQMETGPAGISIHSKNTTKIMEINRSRKMAPITRRSMYLSFKIP